MLYISKLGVKLWDMGQDEIKIEPCPPPQKAGGKTKSGLARCDGFKVSTTFYLNAGASFDIETYKGYMYHWQFSYLDNIYFGRTWEQFIDLIDKIRVANDLYLGAKTSRKIIVLVHNLSYEFQWLKTKIENNTDKYNKTFFKSSSNCLVYDCGVFEFRDTLAITGLPLKLLKKQYNLSCGKSGDAEKIRISDNGKLRAMSMHEIAHNSKTPLTLGEKRYCLYDVATLRAFWCEYYYPLCKTHKKIYLTQTSIVVDDILKNIENKIELEKWRNAIAKLFPVTIDKYLFTMKYLYRGGYTHGFYKNLNVVNNMGFMFDITSSYPAVMITEKYPLAPFHTVPATEFEEYRHNDKILYNVLVTFTNVRSKVGVSYENKHKVIKGENIFYDNNKVLWADSLTVFLTKLDFEIYEKVYDFDKMFHVEHLEICDKIGYIPKYCLATLLDAYVLKFEKKQAKQHYAWEKVRCNLQYGISVKQFKCDKFEINARREVVKAEHNATQDAYEKFLQKSTVFPCYWGIYISAYARAKEMRLFLKCAEQGVAIYGDTDSVKLKKDFYIVNFIREENRRLHAKMIRSLKRLNVPTEKHYIFDDLGCWDFEGVCYYFKALRNKTYLMTWYNAEKRRTELKVTVAGLTESGKNYIKQQARPYEFFADEMEIIHSGKLRPIVFNNTRQETITDRYSNAEEMTEDSGILLEEVTFKCGLDAYWLELIERERNEND